MLKIAVEAQWQKAGLGTLKIRKATPVGGGDINRCFALDTGSGSLFLKVNDRSLGLDFFEAEYLGLKLLGETRTLRVPEPFLYGETEGECFLVMEWLNKASPISGFWPDFAERLTRLHRNTADRFGLERNNFIGTLRQKNAQTECWSEFYVRHRLHPLVRRCVDEGLFSPVDARKAERLFDNMHNIFPVEKPALLHGDLWGGNFLPGPDGIACIFDPAAYYGSREMDLAMARLFGGFDRTFYWHYQDLFPLEPGWQERIPLCQLYPMLVHALLFGGSYVRQAATILSEF